MDIKPYLQRFKAKKITPLQRLFIRYQYTLGILPKNNTYRKKYSKETTKALSKLDAIKDQTIFICKNEITDIDQLRNIRINVLRELKPLFKERQHLYYKLNKTKDSKSIVEIREKIQSLNQEIKQKRKIVKLCDGIADRSTRIEDFFNKEYEQTKRKGVKER